MMLMSWLVLFCPALPSQADHHDALHVQPLNARSFGAIPDDGKDDTVALRYLLGNCSKGGGEVFIPAGHYTVSPLTTQQGGPLPVKTVDILPVSSNCHVRGAGHSPRAMPNVTTIAMATTGGADGKGVNGVDGCWWRMFGWCGNTSRCHEVPSNITITDLHLSGSTNYTEYAQIAGEREHGYRPQPERSSCVPCPHIHACLLPPPTPPP
eukprot:COSAG02_NODE_19992_length_853_cov_2.160477_1_plen_208_part_01